MRVRNRTIFMLIALVAAAHGSETTDARSWRFTGNLLYTSRSLDGTVVSRNAINPGLYGDLITTADSMGVDDSRGVMLSLEARRARLGLGVTYMPTSFRGSGSALVAGSGSSAGFYVQTLLDTRIDIDMLLGNLSYSLIQTADTVLGIGAGLGTTRVDLSIVPETGTALVYDGSQPFGFLNMHFASRYQRLQYGFSLNGLSMDVDGAAVSYSDYTVKLAYCLYDEPVAVHVTGGYRLVNFALDMEGRGWRVRTDTSL